MIENLKLKIKNCHESVSKIVFYLILLLLPTQLGKHFWPSFSYVSGIRIDYLSPTIYLTDILILLLFIGWIFTICFNFKNLDIKNSIKIKNFKLKILFLLFLLIGIISSKTPLAGFYGLFKLGEFAFFGFYVSRNINKAPLSKITLIFSLGIIVESLLAIGQFFYQGSIGGLLYFLGERTFNAQTPGIANASINGELILRPYGTFPHPNVLAGYLIIAMTMVIYNLKFKIYNLRKIVCLTSLIIGTAALFLTMSRVAIAIWLILVIFVILNLFQHPSFASLRSASWRRSNLIFVLRLPRVLRTLAMTILIVLLIGSIGIILFTSPLRSRFIASSLFEESVGLRVQLIQNSILMIKDHPIFGVGINNFLAALPSYAKFDKYTFFQEIQPVHNIYLLVLAETGIPGFLLFIWLLIKSFQQPYKKEFQISNFQFLIKPQKLNFKNLDIKNSIKIKNFKFKILLIILILGMFDHYFLTLQQGQLLFAFVFGLFWTRDRINL